MRLCICVKCVDLFYKGLKKYTAHTDTKHNTKSSRYQLFVGGKMLKLLASISLVLVY